MRPGRGCIDHIFTIRQVLEHRHTYRSDNGGFSRHKSSI
ncbi:unnamed protein product [Schistosoma mattheei]|uniref:Uncharacterized protein n=1 Tax=Schistosoma mattheei TaxID=31246 RepID=A0A3P8GGD8_9TREM|nr:unnamed protein product [Schistosoma mattheei]